MAAFFVFASLLFPSKEVAAYLSQSLKSKNLQLSIDTVKPVFPFKFQSGFHGYQYSALRFPWQLKKCIFIKKL